ncbi:MAG: DUF4296 domain-containing protein [Tannerellaceae bacterium]|nr:DUF4296 domain-containing protein [Tannerellaceae bacterium]MCD8262933.1 DUF4296 domain-containing protein [Tannerellaceae bacterium]
MRNNSRIYYIILSVLTLLLAVACGKTPRGVLSEKKMQSVYLDMQLAEAMINADSKEYADVEKKEALYESVFRKHKITQAVYDSSLVWYGANLDVFVRVYDRVLKDISQMQKDLSDMPADPGPASGRDSVNIWNRRPSLVFEPNSPFNAVVFDIKPEASYLPGSIFVLDLDVWGVNPGMAHYPEIKIHAEHADTTIMVNDRITQDGPHQTVLRSHATKRIRRIYGIIRMDNTGPWSYGKIYVDSIRLMKYNYGSFTDTDSVDTPPADTSGDEPVPALATEEVEASPVDSI